MNRAQPGYIIDSILPIEEQLRRFRAGLEPVRDLSTGGRSRDELVRRFADALERRDTTALRTLLITRSEFAYLIYPSSPYTRAPYTSAPQLVWMLLVSNSRKGASRLFERLGGHPLAYSGHRCRPRPDRQGDNTLWVDCRMLLGSTARDTAGVRLFGSIVEHRGRYKFLSLENDM